MKKLIVVFVLLFIFSSLFASCKKTEDNSIIGKWIPSSIEIQGKILTMDEYTDLTGINLDMVIEFKNDNTFVLIVDGVAEYGDYSITDNSIEMKDSIQTKVLSFVNDEIILETLNGTMTFIKK